MGKATAVYGMSNFGGIEILDIEYGIDDTVLYRYNFGELQRTRKARIYYTMSGKPYFRTPTGRVYLDECMRV